MSEGLGQITGALGPTTRNGTLSPFDFAYWASTFVATGEPNDYLDDGPETTGISLVSWAASQIGVSFTTDFATAATILLESSVTIPTALRARGSLLVSSSKMVVCLGFDDVVDIVNGRYFIRRLETADHAKWSYGAQLPGAIY